MKFQVKRYFVKSCKVQSGFGHPNALLEMALVMHPVLPKDELLIQNQNKETDLTACPLLCSK